MVTKNKSDNFFDEVKEFFIKEKGYILKSQTKDIIIFESQQREWGFATILLLILGVYFVLWHPRSTGGSELGIISGILAVFLSFAIYFFRSLPTVTITKVGCNVEWQGSSIKTNKAISEIIKDYEK